MTPFLLAIYIFGGVVGLALGLFVAFGLFLASALVWGIFRDWKEQPVAESGAHEQRRAA